MIIALALVIVAVSLLFFGYGFIKNIAPFVFFGLGLSLTFYLVHQKIDSIAVDILITVLLGTFVGFILATFSGVLLSLAVVAGFTLAAYNVLLYLLHQQLHFSVGFSQGSAVAIITVFILATIDTYVMRYIVTASASALGAYLLFRVITTITDLDKAGFLTTIGAVQYLALCCIALAIAGFILQTYYLRRSLRPNSDPGLLSLDDYPLPGNS